MSSSQSVVVSMRLPAESGRRLKRMARRHGWTASDAGARLVEEGLRRSEFAFIDFRDSMAGRQACLQGSTLASRRRLIPQSFFMTWLVFFAFAAALSSCAWMLESIMSRAFRSPTSSTRSKSLRRCRLSRATFI